MSSKNEHGPEGAPDHVPMADSDNASLRALLAALEREDQDAYETLSRENPQLFAVLPDERFDNRNVNNLDVNDGGVNDEGVNDEGISDEGIADGGIDSEAINSETIAQIRQALLQEDLAAPDTEFAKLVAQTTTRLAQIREATVQQQTPAEADRGVLTDVTRTLAPEMAAALYRKITPLIVFEILRKLDRSARLDTVHTVTEHLCAEDVQKRLQQCPHARDAIVDELCVCLGDVGFKKELDRAKMLEVMEACGVLSDLEAMANCLQLGKTKAG